MMFDVLRDMRLLSEYPIAKSVIGRTCGTCGEVYATETANTDGTVTYYQNPIGNVAMCPMCFKILQDMVMERRKNKE